MPGDQRGAVVAEGQVEGVGDRVGDAAEQVLLAVRAAQIRVHVTQRPVPVDAGGAELAEVGQERLGQRAALAGEPVGALGHPVADRQVALLLADVEQGVGQLDGPLGEQRGDQRQLGAVDVPHRAEVEDERAVHRPERALVRREAGLDQRVVERGGEDRPPLAGRGVHRDGVQVLAPLGGGVGAAGVEPVRAGAAVVAQVLLRLLDAAQREPEPQLDDLTGPGRSAPHQPERAQRGRPDPVEVEPGAAGDESPVVPEQLAEVRAVALQVHGQRRPLDDHLGLGDAGLQGLQVGPQRDGGAVRDEQAAQREVDDDPRVVVLRERVAVDRAARADGDLAADARRQGGRVVAGLGDLVAQLPAGAEGVERLEHRGDPEVVVVLADRAGAGLVEVAEAGGDLLLVHPGRHALGVQLVQPVAGGVGAGVGAGRHHAERVGRARVGVADLRLGPPPAGGQALRRGELGRAGPDEGVHVLEHSASLSAGG